MKRILVLSAVLVISVVGLYQIDLSLSAYLSAYMHRSAGRVSIIIILLTVIPIAFRLKKIFSPSKEQSTLTHRFEAPRFIGDVVFVHGMDGHPKKTWVTANGNSSWAEWLKEDRPDLRVWSFGYPASSSAWIGNAMQLNNRAINFLECLQVHGIGEKPVCFITHSLGGLVVKQLLEEAVLHYPKKYKPIADRVRGVVFIATPHFGSILANLADKLKFLTRPTQVITDLAPSYHLHRLNTWYRDHVAKAKIKTLLFIENNPTRGFMVVPFNSADANIPGVVTIPIDSDHINICKPTDKKALVYSSTLKFLDEVFPRPLKKFNVPHQVAEHFTDREEVIARMRSRFNAGESVQSLNGIGGVGKTQTVIKYAYKYRDEYGAVFWAKAQSRESLVSDFVTIARLLDLRDKDEQDQNRAINAVKNWFENNNDWLLILDNADDPALAREFTTSNKQGHVILTIRDQIRGKGAAPNELVKWGPNEGALFLLRRSEKIAKDASLKDAPDDLRTQAEELSKALDGLPLALDQAGAYILETRTSLAQYLELYNNSPHKLLSRRGEDIEDHPESVTCTFRMSFDRVAAVNSAAADLLRLCAFLDADSIPEEIFQQGADVLGESLGSVATDQMELIEAIKHCRQLSLLNRNEDRTVSVHRLVQVVLRNAINSETQLLWAERAVRVVNRAFPNVEYATWPSCERLIRHALALVRYIDELEIVIPEAARLLNRAGGYLKDRARFAEAEPLYRRSLEICEKALGTEHHNVAGALNNLALFYASMGRDAEAEPLYQRGLAIYEKTLGPEDDRVATTLNNLAMVYCSMSKYTEAELLYQRSLQIYEKTVEPDDPQIASVLSNLAELYDTLGRYPVAEKLYERLLAINKKAVGPENPDFAITLNNLAKHYYLRGMYEEAEKRYKQALAILEKTFGREHTHVATTLNNLARLYQRQMKYELAKPLYERALKIYQKTLGPDHCQVTQTRDALAQLYDHF
jgi:tetratricopeptide (TPR) repeat protein/predicted alpha/beta hydrolase family esterase